MSVLKFQSDQPNFQTMLTGRPAEAMLDQTRSHSCFNHIDADLTSIQWLLSSSGPGVDSLPEAPAPYKRGALASLRLIPSDVKPPFSYTDLICMAIEASGEDQVTLSYIIAWITETFPYFRSAGKAWQNSIRHRLSNHHLFVRVPKKKTERRRGGYWAINPLYSRRPYKRRNTAVSDGPKVDAVPQVTCATTTTTYQAWNPQESEGSVDSGYCSPLQEGHIYRTPDIDLMLASKRLEEGPASAKIFRGPDTAPEAPAQVHEISADLDLIWAEISHMDFREMDLPDGGDTYEFFTEEIMSLI